MTRRTTAQVIVAVVLLVFGGGIWLTGGELHPQWLRFYSAAVLIATAVLGLWDRVLWHLGPAQRVQAVPRDLRGTWKGTLTSFWQDPGTGTSPPSKPAYLVVRQSATSVSATLLTDESRSHSSLGEVAGTEAGTSLIYMYLNIPASRHEHRSRIHHGSTSLDVIGRPATRLTGHYWTDRDSRGELDFVERTKHLADDYDSAQQLFS